AVIDAHTEALAQLERALRFDLEPEQRRVALRDAAQQAYDLSRFADIERFIEEALAIPGGSAEDLASLHQHAARAARHRGDLAADEGYLAAAERLLEALPPSPQRASIATARVARAAVDVQPERLAAAAERALRIARALDDADIAARVEAQVQAFVVVSRLDSGDPAGLDLLEEVTRLADQHHLPGGVSATALLNAYEGSVLSLFHETATLLHERALDAFRRHELGWQSWIAPSRVLELVQRGRYEEARALTGTITAPEAGTPDAVVLSCAGALREARAGSLDQARAALAAGKTERGFQQAALIDVVRLELAMLTGDSGLGELAQGVYGRMNRHHYARVAGVAAVGLARSGRGSPPPPPWLVADAPLRVLWEWAAGIDRHDAALLRVVAARLTAMHCPYEAALALRDAGDFGAAYRALRALGATTAREQVAEDLRLRGERIPRRSRSALDPDGLTETERQVCRLVATGASNEQVAARLTVSVHTVETHLTHIYQKTGQRGRTALIVWWLHRTSETVAP
ncbi:MAG: LuxR C-terminal-related transcriptional regulator, partial [Dehalococcoidia bacterium]